MDKEAEQVQISTRERVYNFIVEFILKNSYSPSIREICEGAHLSSTASVHYYLKALKLIGMIDMKKNISRSIRLIGYEYVKVENLISETI